MTNLPARLLAHMRAHAVDGVFSGGMTTCCYALGCSNNAVPIAMRELQAAGAIELIEKSRGRYPAKWRMNDGVVMPGGPEPVSKPYAPRERAAPVDHSALMREEPERAEDKVRLVAPGTYPMRGFTMLRG